MPPGVPKVVEGRVVDLDDRDVGGRPRRPTQAEARVDRLQLQRPQNMRPSSTECGEHGDAATAASSHDLVRRRAFTGRLRPKLGRAHPPTPLAGSGVDAKLFARVAMASAIALPATPRQRTAEHAGVEAVLLERINPGPSGRVTRDVRCSGHGGVVTCTLHGVD